MTTDKEGNSVTFDERLEDIKSRYGENSIQYLNSEKLISELKQVNLKF